MMNNMTTRDFLKQYGLTAKQIDIYLDLAAHPDSTVVNISKRARLPRSTIYLELQRLTQAGTVISKNVGKTTLFKVTDPKVLKLSLQDEVARLSNLTANLDSFNNMIQALAGAKPEPLSVNIYKGSPGIKQLLWNILIANPKEVVGFSPGQLEDITDRDFAEKWRAEFKLRNMHNKIIFNNAKPLDWSNVPGFLGETVAVKTLDAAKIKFDRMILVYDGVVTICSLNSDEDQYGIEIRDKLLFQSYWQLFDFLWEHVANPLTI
jgi:sugar-specific transcriptional regulator TrmB